MWSTRAIGTVVLLALFVAPAIATEQRTGLKRPAGWIGAWPPEAKERRVATAEVPGGGAIGQSAPAGEGSADPPAADPEPNSAEPADAATPASTGSEPAPEVAKTVDLAPRHVAMETRPGDGYVSEAEAAVPRFAPAVNGEGLDIPRASLPVSKDFNLDGLRGGFTWSTDREKEPPFIYVQYGFATTIELMNGETPAGGAICGLCGKNGAFEVTKVSNRIGIKPREMSDPNGRGVLASNVTLMTDTGRTLTFVVVEVTGLGIQRTDRHEVRSSRGDGEMVPAFTFDAQVAEASQKIDAQYRQAFEQKKDALLDAKAQERFEVYSDFEVEQKAKGRRITFESVATVGDRTVLKFHCPADVSLSTPVAMVQYGKQLRVLSTKSLAQERKVVDDDDWMFYTLITEPAALTGEQRIAVSISDLDHGKELRSSAGRS